MTAPHEKPANPIGLAPTRSGAIPWQARLALVLFMAVAAATVWITNQQC